MKLLNTRNVFFLAAISSLLPSLILSGPVSLVATGTDLQVHRHPNGRSEDHVNQRDDFEAILCKNDTQEIEVLVYLAEIESRGIDLPSVPKPKPLGPGHEPGGSVPPVAPVSPKPGDESGGVVPEQPSWQEIPATTNPGAGPGLGNDPKPMGDYEQAGTAQLNSYGTIIRGNQPDTSIVKTKAELDNFPQNKAFLDFRQNKNYAMNEQEITIANDLKALKQFDSTELGFDINQILAGKFLSRLSISNQNGKGVSVGVYDKTGQFIIYEEAFKDNNDKVPDKTPLNEINMQNFINYAEKGSAPTQNFKAAYFMDIQNKEFWAITRQNYNDAKQTFDHPLTFQSGTDQFNRYMGSPNIRSKFYSYGNHHAAIGNKVPEKIIVMPKQATPGYNKLMAVLVFKDS